MSNSNKTSNNKSKKATTKSTVKKTNTSKNTDKKTTTKATTKTKKQEINKNNSSNSKQPAKVAVNNNVKKTAETKKVTATKNTKSKSATTKKATTSKTSTNTKKTTTKKTSAKKTPTNKKTSTTKKGSKKTSSKKNNSIKHKKKETALLVIENKKKNVFSKRVPIFIVLFLFITASAFSGFKLINYSVDAKKTEEIVEDISQDIVIQEVVKDDVTEEKFTVNFESLKEKNPDTVAFLKVNGTDIQYVVTKARNNKFYLNHGFDKEYNAGGWVFADYTNKFDGTDKNIVIYGHNMHNGTMFGSLKNIFTPEWQEEDKNRYIKFITEEGESVYEVFSIYEILNEDYYIRTDLSDREFPDFINRMQRRSFYDFGVDLENTESILTLSTCSGNNKYRVVLQAKKLTDEIDLLFVTD